MTVSVIIPSLNEAKNIARTLEQVCDPLAGFHEVIVADGGSKDGTQDLCKEYPCRLLALPRSGRGYQLHQGALEAKGDILFFLHADTLLPQNAVSKMEAILADPSVSAGGFSKVFDDKNFLLAGGVTKCKLRLRFLKAIAGDQGLFLRSQTYHRSEGYPDVRVMEEFFLCKKLCKLGKLILADDCVITSARRFLTKGVLRCYLRMTLVSIFFYLRFPPRILERVYYAD